MSGGADPDPLESFEAGYGSRGTRGIRGGKAAKRKREAYLNWQESQGRSRASTPIVHAGGQSRPLNTSPFWHPSDSSGDEAAVEAVEAAVEDRATEVVDLTQVSFLSQANPEVQRLVPRAKLYSQSRVTASNPLLRPRPSSSSSARPSSSSSARPSPVDTSVPSQPVIRPLGVDIDPSVRVFVPEIWGNQYRLVEVEGVLRRIEGPVIAVDYHQVLDVDRSERVWVSVSDSGILPQRNCAWFGYFNKKLHEIAGPRQSRTIEKLCSGD